MQGGCNEPSYWGLFRAQEKLNWSLSGAIAPAAIVLLNYMQKKMNLEDLPTSFGASTSNQEGYFHCSLSHKKCCLAATSFRNLSFPSLFPLLLKGHAALTEGAGSCITHASSTEDKRASGKTPAHTAGCSTTNSSCFAFFLEFFYFSNTLCPKTPSCQAALPAKPASSAH